LDIVKAWCVIIINLVSVIFVNSSSKEQNLVTFASSRGASTSSKTQIGEGLVKKTANISDRAVKACSPPDNSVIDCYLLPGGLTNMSKPASNGSSDSTNSNFAVPPLKSYVYTSLNFLLTFSNASKSFSLPF